MKYFFCRFSTSTANPVVVRIFLTIYKILFLQIYFIAESNLSFTLIFKTILHYNISYKKMSTEIFLCSIFIFDFKTKCHIRYSTLARLFKLRVLVINFTSITVQLISHASIDIMYANNPSLRCAGDFYAEISFSSEINPR